MKTLKRMIMELDDYYQGLLKHILCKLGQYAIVASICIIFTYSVGHWLLNEIVYVLLIIPFVSMFIAFPMLWWLDIKPETDKLLKSEDEG